MVSSHFYPDFGLCECRQHCQNFRDEVEIGLVDNDTTSDDEIPEDIVSFADERGESSHDEHQPRSSSRDQIQLETIQYSGLGYRC